MTIDMIVFLVTASRTSSSGKRERQRQRERERLLWCQTVQGNLTTFLDRMILITIGAERNAGAEVAMKVAGQVLNKCTWNILSSAWLDNKENLN